MTFGGQLWERDFVNICVMPRHKGDEGENGSGTIAPAHLSGRGPVTFRMWVTPFLVFWRFLLALARVPVGFLKGSQASFLGLKPCFGGTGFHAGLRRNGCSFPSYPRV